MPQPPASASASGQPRSRYRYVVAGALCVVYTFNFLDRQFLSILAQPVKLDLHLSDTQLGMLTGLMFALFYTVFGIPVAALADRTNRVRLLAVASGLWSLFTATCGLATGFVSLAFSRIGVGVGEAGGSAPAYSIISDYFAPEERGVGLAIYSLGVPFGTMLGAASGGWIAAHYGWRAAFLVLGAIGLVLAPIVPLIVREPVRGALDPVAGSGAVEPPASAREAIVAFLGSPTLVLTALSAGLIAFVSYGLINWAPSYLIRHDGMSLTQLATRYSLVAGVGIGVGTWLGGYLVDHFAKARPALYAVIPGAGILLATPFLFGFTQTRSWQVALAWLMGPMVLNSLYLAPALAVVQNGIAPRHRSVAGAIFLFTLNLIGLSGGPVFVGLVSDHFAPTLGAAQALKIGLHALAPVFILAFVVELAAAWRLGRPSPSPLSRLRSTYELCPTWFRGLISRSGVCPRFRPG